MAKSKICLVLLVYVCTTFTNGYNHLLSYPAQAFLQMVGNQPTQIPSSVFSSILSSEYPQSRLPVNGFGSTGMPSQRGRTDQSFSNPPPPQGSGLSAAEQSCGISPPFCTNTRYRSIDGSCNNLVNPTWGTAQTPYGRLLPANYGDGVAAFPRSSNGQPLANPRKISLRLYPDRQLVDPIFNLNGQQWGQIVTHDMSLTAGVTQSHREPLVCCDDNGQLSPDASTNPSCAPILVPPTDPVHAPLGTTCMNFVRTGTTRDRGCTSPNAPAQPVTFLIWICHWCMATVWHRLIPSEQAREVVC